LKFSRGPHLSASPTSLSHATCPCFVAPLTGALRRSAPLMPGCPRAPPQFSAIRAFGALWFLSFLYLMRAPPPQWPPLRSSGDQPPRPFSVPTKPPRGCAHTHWCSSCSPRPPSRPELCGFKLFPISGEQRRRGSFSLIRHLW
jgi:hypothetical protein